MEKGLKRVNYVFLAVLIMWTIGYDVFRAFPMKCLASLTFVVLGFINCTYVWKNNKEKFKIAALLLAGLVFGMGGDVAIYFNFIMGAASFAVGHIFYCFTYGAIEKIRKSDLICTAVILVAILSFLFLTPIFDFGDIIMKVVVIVYCVIICSMTAKSIMNAYRNHTKVNILFACGSVMFFFSDIMLVLNVFADTSHITSILCHTLYFPAQWVLTHGMFYLATENKR